MNHSSAVHAKAVLLGQHAMRMTTEAGSGHPSTCLAIAHLVVELMYRQMRYDVADPWNLIHDRLVLSVGHAVPIVYAACADLGVAAGRSEKDAFPLGVDHLWKLREQDSVLDGHPNPAEGFPFFDAATGSLGQGLSVAAGLATAAVADNTGRRVFCICGDGESREGQIWEAVDFIVDRNLQNLCTIFSCNGHGQAGPVSAQQSAQTLQRKLEAFGMTVLMVDGHQPDELHAAFARFGSTDRPLAIVAKTVKGWGVDMMLGSNYHGKPVPADSLQRAMDELAATGRKLGAADSDLAPARKSEGSRYIERESVAQDKLPAIDKAFARVGYEKNWEKKNLATRNAYGAALVALGDADPRIVALDADVSNSTFADHFAKLHTDRFFECKIAEQNMISVAAGMAAAGKIPFVSSFAKFLARGNDQIDMASISRANIKIVGSHAGVSLAADGPSQMSLADVAYVRSMTRADNGYGHPAAYFFQPSDAISAYHLTVLMANTTALCYMRTHRPNAAFLYKPNETFPLRGVKQLLKGRSITLVSSGYMVHQTLAAAERLTGEGISCNLFDAYTLPMDASPILAAAREAGGHILVIEDNYLGGFHAELAEAAAAEGDVRVSGLWVNRIPKSARTPEEVFTYVGVGLEQIVSRARTLAGK